MLMLAACSAPWLGRSVSVEVMPGCGMRGPVRQGRASRDYGIAPLPGWVQMPQPAQFRTPGLRCPFEDTRLPLGRGLQALGAQRTTLRRRRRLALLKLLAHLQTVRRCYCPAPTVEFLTGDGHVGP